MSAASAAKKSTVLNDAVLEASKPKTKQKTQVQDTLNANITANPFYNVMFDESLTLADKQSEVAKMTTSTLDRNRDRAQVKAYDEFREWLSAQQTELAEQVINLSNVDSMSELQSVLKDMNTDLLDFEDNMNPIMSIIESIHYLRTNGLMGDAFKQIKEDKEREETLQAEIEVLKNEAQRSREMVAQQEAIKIQASTKRSFFGLGGLTSEAQADIAGADIAIVSERENHDKLMGDINSLKAQMNVPAENGDAAEHKARLRELLDMSDEANRDRVIALRDSASKFITTAKERTGSLRGQFDQLAGQIGNVEDSNQSMIKVYAVLNEGMKDATKKNAEIRAPLAETPEEESMVDKMTREEKLRALDGHVSHISRSQGETMAAYGDLNQQAIRVHTMRQSTDQQIDTARLINTQGVAATADRLATVLTAVSGAALGEASEAAKDTLSRMRESTNDISSREVIRVAMGVSSVNDQLETVFKELEDIREVQQAATGIVRNGMTEMQERMVQLRESANSAKEDLANHIASASIVETESSGEGAAQQAPKTTGFPGV
ncbi:hypothetical protein LCGC14_0043320 [marine sediment metagenome]|uniref:Uncharacterized protein n=2 Tax=root TaxID=1 RepID=A0A7V1FPG6_9RHOB|nr:hypothetical protein [Sulfitobacter litoralis]HDZ53389.1 hypothetical protein [Sulfitobacter litoralis]